MTLSNAELNKMLLSTWDKIQKRKKKKKKQAKWNLDLSKLSLLLTYNPTIIADSCSGYKSRETSVLVSLEFHTSEAITDV